MHHYASHAHLLLLGVHRQRALPQQRPQQRVPPAAQHCLEGASGSRPEQSVDPCADVRGGQQPDTGPEDAVDAEANAERVDPRLDVTLCAKWQKT